eukprot:jgi/Psemu1/307864/fgenesh1_kg.359_\
MLWSAVGGSGSIRIRRCICRIKRRFVRSLVRGRCRVETINRQGLSYGYNKQKLLDQDRFGLVESYHSFVEAVFLVKAGGESYHLFVETKRRFVGCILVGRWCRVETIHRQGLLYGYNKQKLLDQDRLGLVESYHWYHLFAETVLLKLAVIVSLVCGDD